MKRIGLLIFTSGWLTAVAAAAAAAAARGDTSSPRLPVRRQRQIANNDATSDDITVSRKGNESVSNGLLQAIEDTGRQAERLYKDNGTLDSKGAAVVKLLAETEDKIQGSHAKAALACGIQFGDRFIQIGKWRLGDVNGVHASMAHRDGQTAVVFKSDGTFHVGPRTDMSTWSRIVGNSSGVSFGDRFIQIGKWRLGDVNGVHASMAHQGGQTAVLFKSDGTVHGGPRTGMSTWSRTVLCQAPRYTYISGPNVSNDAFMVCSAKSYTLAYAQSLCDASDDCRALHDYACDGKNWRYCETNMATIMAANSGTSACTKKKSVCEDFTIQTYFSGASGTSYGSKHSSATSGTGFGIEDCANLCLLDGSCKGITFGNAKGDVTDAGTSNGSSANECYFTSDLTKGTSTSQWNVYSVACQEVDPGSMTYEAYPGVNDGCEESNKSSRSSGWITVKKPYTQATCFAECTSYAYFTLSSDKRCKCDQICTKQTSYSSHGAYRIWHFPKGSTLHLVVNSTECGYDFGGNLAESALSVHNAGVVYSIGESLSKWGCSCLEAQPILLIDPVSLTRKLLYVVEDPANPCLERSGKEISDDTVFTADDKATCGTGNWTGSWQSQCLALGSASSSSQRLLVNALPKSSTISVLKDVVIPVLEAISSLQGSGEDGDNSTTPPKKNKQQPQQPRLRFGRVSFIVELLPRRVDWYTYRGR